MEETYSILNEIEKLNHIEKVYELHCPRCKYSTGDIYQRLHEVPVEYFCDHCDNDIKPLDGLIIIYKVINE